MVAWGTCDSPGITIERQCQDAEESSTQAAATPEARHVPHCHGRLHILHVRSGQHVTRTRINVDGCPVAECQRLAYKYRDDTRL